MEQLLGLVAQGESGLVCKLCRFLCDLKQSPRASFGKSIYTMQVFELKRSDVDCSVFLLSYFFWEVCLANGLC